MDKTMQPTAIGRPAPDWKPICQFDQLHWTKRDPLIITTKQKKHKWSVFDIWKSLLFRFWSVQQCEAGKINRSRVVDSVQMNPPPFDIYGFSGEQTHKCLFTLSVTNTKMQFAIKGHFAHGLFDTYRNAQKIQPAELMEKFQCHIVSCVIKMIQLKLSRRIIFPFGFGAA